MNSEKNCEFIIQKNVGRNYEWIKGVCDESFPTSELHTTTKKGKVYLLVKAFNRGCEDESDVRSSL